MMEFLGLDQGFLQRALLAVVLLAPLCALVGVPVVNLRLAYLTDAIGHTALAGVAVGLLVGIDPRWSTLALSLVLAGGILAVARRSRLSTDTVIGILAATVVAFGLALLSRERGLAREAQRFLVGDVLTVDGLDLALLGGAAALAVGILGWRWNRLLALAFDPDLAEVHGRARRLDRWLLALVLAVATALIVRAVGVLLATALVVIPAATARTWSSRAATQPWIALVTALVAGAVGLLLSAQPSVATASGPTIVLVAAALFGVATLRRP
jgi:zinc transport system permease protein